jgi:hypothetical protein
VVLHLQRGAFELDSTFTFDWRIDATEVRLVGEPGATLGSAESGRRRLQASNERVIAIHVGAPLVVLQGLTFRRAPLLVAGGELVLDSCRFEECVADSGGAIMQTGGVVSARDCTFVANSAQDGGAVRVDGGRASFANCSFEGNSAASRGGALFLSSTAHVTLSDTTLLVGNTAPEGSETVWLDAGTLIYRLPAPLGRWIGSEGAREAQPLNQTGGLSTDYPRPCAPGLFGGDDQLATQAGPGCSGLCPGGNTCPGATVVPIPCASGHFCPEGSPLPSPCAAGTWSSARGLVASSQCSATQPGYYSYAGSTAPAPCGAPSFYCPGGGGTPVAVTSGYETWTNTSLPGAPSDGDDTSTRTSERLLGDGMYYEFGVSFTCPAGSLCVDGAREPCPGGTFQDETKATSCKACQAGGFCPLGAVASVDCPSGSFTAATNLSSDTQCTGCPVGHYCLRGDEAPRQCAAGTFAPNRSLDQCISCAPGTEQPAENATACVPCARGFFASHPGQQQCSACLDRTSSESGATDCDEHCAADFYLHDLGTPASRENCEACPAAAACDWGTTIETLSLSRNHWRLSLRTVDIHSCPESGGVADSACEGSANGTGDGYCAAGYAGPRCEVCLRSAEYFNDLTHRCEACPSAARLALVFGGGLAGLVALLGAVYGLATAPPRKLPLALRGAAWVARRLVSSSATVAVRLGLQEKFKVVVSFLQVWAVLRSVYGVHLSPQLTAWIPLVNVGALDVVDLAFPGTCVGSMYRRLLFAALWPFALIAVLVLAIAAFKTIKTIVQEQAERATGAGRPLAQRILVPSIYVSLLVSYCALPTVSRGIFAAWHCDSFGYDDLNAEKRAYLVADWSIQCGSAEHRSLTFLAWGLLALWPIGVPATYAVLLALCARSIRADRISTLAGHVRFLWGDYQPAFFFWECADISRKLLLTSFVLFVDQEHGSTRVLRLYLATALSVMYVVVLCLARPLRRADNLYLAALANLLLTLCFVSGIIIKLCEQDDESALATETTCEATVGLASKYQTSLIVVVASAIVLAAAVLMICWQAITTQHKTIRLRSSREEPVLTLPRGCHFHAFVSHAWSTGQDQTHTLVRQLQLLCPSMRLWLDVEQLDDVGKLEESVRQSAIFCIFLSKARPRVPRPLSFTTSSRLAPSSSHARLLPLQGYFASPNCRRELFTALGKKPLVVVHEADENKGGATLEEMKRECVQHYAGWPGGTGEDACELIFAGEPITWVRVRDFQLVSLRLVVAQFLQHIGTGHATRSVGSSRRTRASAPVDSGRSFNAESFGSGRRTGGRASVAAAYDIEASDLFVPGELDRMHFHRHATAPHSRPVGARAITRCVAPRTGRCGCSFARTTRAQRSSRRSSRRRRRRRSRSSTTAC